MKPYPYLWLKNISALLEKRAYSPFNILLFAVFVGSFRRFLEWTMGGVAEPFPLSFAVTLSSFYWLTFYVFALILRLLVKQPWRVSINVILVGIFLGIFPPIIDTLAHGTGFRYAYMWGVPTNFNWLLYNPELGIPIGETVVLWAVIFFTTAYVALRTRSLGRSLAAFGLAYGALILLGGLASVAAVLLTGIFGWQPTHQIALVNLQQIVFALLIYFVLQPRLLTGLVRRGLPVLGYLAAAVAGAFFTAGISATTAAYLPLLLVALGAARGERDAGLAGATYLDPDDLHFLRITAGFVLAALAAANAAVFLPLTALVAAAYVFPRGRAATAIRAACAYLVGAVASVEHSAYGAPRWWISFLPEPASPELVGAFPAHATAVLMAVAAGAYFTSLVAGRKRANTAPGQPGAYAAYRVAALSVAAASMRVLFAWVFDGHYPTLMLATTLLWAGQYFLGFHLIMLALKLARPQPWRETARRAAPWISLGALAPLLGLGEGAFGRMWTPPAKFDWLLHYPAQGIAAGEAAMWWLIIAAGAASVWQTTRHPGRTAAAAAGGYVAAVLLIMVPSLAAEYLRLRLGWPEEFRYAVLNALQLSAALVVYAALQTQLLAGGLRRVPHALPFMLISLLGAAFAGQVSWVVAPYAATIFLAGWIALCQNDYFDEREDALQGRARYLDLEDVRFLTVTAVMGVAALAAAHSGATLLAIMAFAAMMLYNFPFYRAKRYFPSNLKIEGIWGFCAFTFGVIAAFENAAYGAPRWWATHSPLPPDALRGPFPGATLAAMFLALGGFSLVAVLKDYKDWQADQAAGVLTLYTVAAKRGWNLTQVHAVVRALCAAAVASAPVLTTLAGKTAWPWAAGGFFAAGLVWWVMAPPPSTLRFRMTLLVLAAYFVYLVAALLAGPGA